MNKSLVNLFGFYRATGISPSVLLLDENGFSVVCGEENRWPQMVFGLDFSENPAYFLDQVLSETKAQNLPGFAVCSAALFGSDELQYLREKGVFPIRTWTLMDAVPSIQPTKIFRENIQIRKIKVPAEIAVFTNLVNTELMQSVKIAGSLLNELNKTEAVNIYGLFVENELVSGLLAFTEEKTTGLYFIVTKQQCRGKGLASDLIGYVLNLCRQKSEMLVLQAVQKAVPLYSRLGFSAREKVVIFWKQ
ncbi:Acetyltransferase (GNAT) domain-containing protein [Mariniphaga anaerophila]|uniref:Acetyltransferase (GNAT) domain-containing protein n=1 Tax=Mariniphaga anaerophila TaxID=1484053 RepID=A0A1M5B8F7_9BACT|nr:GNAT family N-acetyltransferase [Mariniphaga anaerophila]SHF38728.1 Acetyltransferase (GNAT) domain-containing protein [Mariniphaga anaerophila]